MKNKKAMTLWHSALRSIDEVRISEIRANLGIPKEGFFNKTKLEDWYSNNQDDSLTLLNKLHSYRDEVSKMSDSISVGFSPAIEEYIINGEIEVKTLKKCDPTGCKLKLVINDESTDEFPVGVYLHFGPHSTPTDVKEYLMSKKQFIDEVRKMLFPNRKGRLKSEDYYKNITIGYLANMDREELNCWALEVFQMEYAHLPTQDILISKIMKKLGRDVTNDNVRRIISRENKKRSL